MSESRNAEHDAWQEHVKKLKKKVAEGKIDPYQDPETLKEMDEVSQPDSSQVEEDYDTNTPLPKNPDQDPYSPAQHLPRKPFGKPTNQPVVTQSTLKGEVQKVVLSRSGNTRILKPAQPYERGRLDDNTPKDNQEADEQRQQIRRDMRKRGNDV